MFQHIAHHTLEYLQRFYVFLITSGFFVGAFTCSETLLMKFFIETYSLSISSMALIYLIFNACFAIYNPLIGTLIDYTRQRSLFGIQSIQKIFNLFFKVLLGTICAGVAFLFFIFQVPVGLAIAGLFILGFSGGTYSIATGATFPLYITLPYFGRAHGFFQTLENWCVAIFSIVTSVIGAHNSSVSWAFVNFQKIINI